MQLVWLAPAALFATVQIIDVHMYGFTIYDHYTSWGVTWVALFFLCAAIAPRAAFYMWHFTAATFHMIVFAITVIIAHEPGHFMEIQRDIGAPLAWVGHTLLHLLPLITIALFHAYNTAAVVAALRALSPVNYMLVLAAPVLTLTLYVALMDPRSKYGTTLSLGYLFAPSVAISIGVGEFGTAFRWLRWW